MVDRDETSSSQSREGDDSSLGNHGRESAESESAPAASETNQSSTSHDAAEARDRSADTVLKRKWPLTSLTLIERMKSDDSGSWSDFVHLYGGLIKGFCSRRLPANDVEDIVQCIFIRIVRGIQRFTYNKDKGSFSGWLRKITRNEILRHYVFLDKEKQVRSDGDLSMIVSGTSRSDWDDEYTQWLLETALERAESEVSANEWHCFMVSWKSDLALKELAVQEAVDINTLYKARCRVSKVLRKVVRDLTDDHPFASPDVVAS